MRRRNVMDKKVKRGVAIYSYSGEYGRTMNLEDCFKDMQDMGATGIEILANSHIDSYPELSEEYVAKWEYLCKKYQRGQIASLVRRVRAVRIIQINGFFIFVYV